MTHSSVDGTSSVLLNKSVVRLFDVRDPAASAIPPPSDFPPNGSNFLAPAYPDYPASAPWNANALGQVFGVTLDDAANPNIYVTAASIYGLAGPRLAGGGFIPGQFAATPGTIFQIDGTSGAVSAFANVLTGWCDGRPGQNSGPALGQIAFDAAHDQLFVSDFDDGVIYRIATAGNAGGPPGTILGCLDHGKQVLSPTVADDGLPMDASFYSGNTSPASGFTQMERRVWAVQVYGGRLYYSTWREDKLRPLGGLSNTIYSVPLLASGAPNPAGAQLEITLPAFETFAYSNPVADIAVSADGRLLAAERTMFGDVGPGDSAGGSWAHQGRVIEYRLVSGSWVQEPVNKHQIGNDALVGGPSHPARNSEGGVDWNGEVVDENPDVGNCDSTIVTTGDGLNGAYAPNPNERFIYGLQVHPASGGDPIFTSTPGSGNALFVDWDNNFNGTDDKSSLGSLEAYGPACGGGGGFSCVEILNLEIICLEDGTYQVTFQVVNNSPFSVPAGGIRIFLPGGGPPITLPLTTGGAPGVPSGQTSDPVLFTFTSDGQPGSEYCFSYQLIGLDTDGNGFPQWSCEKTRLCVVLPDCPEPCLDLGDVQQIWRRIFNVNGVQTTLSLMHSGPSPAGHVAVTPLNPGVAVTGPSLVPTPLPPNTPGTVQFIYAGPGAVPGATLQFQIDIHDCGSLTNGYCEWCCTAVLEIVVPPRTLLDGVVFADRDGDGTRGEYEEPLAGWRVTARHGAALLGEARTDASGVFAFDVPLGTGAVEVTIEPEAGWTTDGASATVTCDAEHGCPTEALLFAASDGSEALPVAFRLEATYPNPFASETTIRFTLPEAGPVTLRVFDVLGREVARLVDGEREAGRHHVVFDASALPSGVYVVQLAAGGQVAAERVTLLR